MTLDEAKYIEILEFVLNGKPYRGRNDTCENLLNHEKNRFLPLPKNDYVFYHERKGKVSKQGMIRFDHNTYSVPEMYKSMEVLVKFNEKSIYIMTKDRKNIIAKYSRINKRGKHKHRIWYMIHKLKNKSNGFVDSEEFKSMSRAEKLIFEKVYKCDCSRFLTFIELVRDQPRDLIRKFVYRFKDILEEFTIERLVSEILEI